MTKPRAVSLMEHAWPRWPAPSVQCRTRDLVVRITNWTRDRPEPAYDVEVYLGGVYCWDLSQSFTRYDLQQQSKKGTPWKAQALALAVAFAQKQIAAHMKEVRAQGKERN